MLLLVFAMREKVLHLYIIKGSKKMLSEIKKKFSPSL